VASLATTCSETEPVATAVSVWGSAVTGTVTVDGPGGVADEAIWPGDLADRATMTAANVRPKRAAIDRTITSRRRLRAISGTDSFFLTKVE
jgi:hypothetical protein